MYNDRVQQIIQLLYNIDALLDPDTIDYLDNRVDQIDWDDTRLGNRLSLLVDDIEYWLEELSILQNDISEYPDED